MTEKVAERWDQVYGLDKDPIREFLVHPYLFKISGDLRNKRVLDIGCGNGSLIKKLLAKSPSSICGMDINREFIGFLGKYVQNEKVRVERRDIRKRFPYRSNSFDIAYLLFVLNEVDRINPIIKEAARVLKKRGRLVLMAIHPFYPMKYYAYEKFLGRKNDKIIGVRHYFKRFEGKYMLTIAKEPTPFFHHTMEDLLNPMLANGLSITRIKELTVNERIVKAYPRYKDQTDWPRFLCVETKKL